MRSQHFHEHFPVKVEKPRRQNESLTLRSEEFCSSNRKVGEVTLSSNWPPRGHRVPVPAVDFIIIRVGGGLEQRLQGIYRPLKRFSIT